MNNKSRERKLKNDIGIAHGAMVKAIQENHRLKAAIKRKDEALQESICTICRLCKIINPHHKECTTCDEIENYRQALQNEEA